MQRTSIVADDVRASRELVACWLAELNFETALAANGDSAWETIIQTMPDLVVTDIEMPGQSGLELLRQIREHSAKRVRCMPVVLISSLSDAALEKMVLDLGATAVLAKPLSKTEFQALIYRIRSEGFAARCDPGSIKVPIGTRPVSPTLRRLVEQARRRLS